MAGKMMAHEVVYGRERKLFYPSQSFLRRHGFQSERNYHWLTLTCGKRLATGATGCWSLNGSGFDVSRQEDIEYVINAKTPALYHCRYCGAIVCRDSEKAWVVSDCVKKARRVHLLANGW